MAIKSKAFEIFSEIFVAHKFWSPKYWVDMKIILELKVTSVKV